jgi:hypothetical protein
MNVDFFDTNFTNSGQLKYAELKEEIGPVLACRFNLGLVFFALTGLHFESVSSREIRVTVRWA